MEMHRFPRVSCKSSKAHTAQKMKSSIKEFFSKCDQAHSFLQIWSHLLKTSLMKNFIFCAVSAETVRFHKISAPRN